MVAELVADGGYGVVCLAGPAGGSLATEPSVDAEHEEYRSLADVEDGSMYPPSSAACA